MIVELLPRLKRHKMTDNDRLGLKMNWQLLNSVCGLQTFAISFIYHIHQVKFESPKYTELKY